MFEMLRKSLIMATSRQVVKSSLKVSLFVGTILALINHGNDMLQLSLTHDQRLQILLTYFVPYCVSTYSAVKAMQRHEAQKT